MLRNGYGIGSKSIPTRALRAVLGRGPLQRPREPTVDGVPAFAGGLPPDSEYRHGFRVGGIVSHAFFKPYALTFDFEQMRLLMSGQ